MARLTRRVGIQPGATIGSGTRPPRRAAASGVMVPSGDDVDRAVDPALERGQEGGGGVLDVEQA